MRSTLSRTLRALALTAFVPALAACSGSGPVTDGGDETSGGETGTTYPAYETFDASGYTAQPPPPVEIEHDVPARQMEGTVRLPGTTSAPSSESEPREVDGFRIQVGRSEDRATAERLRDAVLSWWRDASGRAGAPDRLEVVVKYVQPTYRVRVGAFEFQSEADAALDFVRSEYPGAFVVPDRVTVR